MALFNLSVDVDYQKALDKLNKAREKGIYIDLIEKSEQTQSQNNYLHLCLAYFADYYGYTTQYVKDNIYKSLVNADIFVITKRDRLGREYKDLRHSNDLTKDEMSLSIDRWCKWCIEVSELEMPDPGDYKVCMWLRKQLTNKHMM